MNILIEKMQIEVLVQQLEGYKKLLMDIIGIIKKIIKNSSHLK